MLRRGEFMPSPSDGIGGKIAEDVVRKYEEIRSGRATVEQKSELDAARKR